MSAIPFGPEAKDPLWRWGSFLMGIVGFALLLWLFVPSFGLLLGPWRVALLIVASLLLSFRSARRWAQGREPERSFTKTVHPTVNVEGKSGATYVMLEPAKSGGPRSVKVKPRDLGPGWWALYTVFVKAPMALGDAVLTAIWRPLGRRWEASGIGIRRSGDAAEEIDFIDNLPNPGRRQF